jgi:predicted Rossmann-fold nucleotide-binding protein
LTWAQLGQHTKPILMANIDGFWEPLLSLIDHMRATQFIRPGLSVRLLTADHVADILPKLEQALDAVPAAVTAETEAITAKL